MAKLSKKKLRARRMSRAQKRRWRLELERRSRMRSNGLVEPIDSRVKPGSKKFQAIQAEWYAKIAAAEIAKHKDEDDRWKDIEWAENPNSPYIKRAATKARQLTPGKEFYYAMCRNYLTHAGLKGRQKLAWELHTKGLSFRKILKAFNKKFRTSYSVYWMFYFIDDIKTKMLAWNSSSPEGLSDRGQDGFADDVLINDFGLAIAQPYELNRPRED